MGDLCRAIMLAAEYHDGQVDKNGEPYILHPLRVMMRMGTDEERIVAVLHDVCEDTELAPWEIGDRFGNKVRVAVEALTRRENEKYPDFILRVKAAGPLAIRVKLADIADNLDPARFNRLDEATRRRLWVKYGDARVVLLGQDIGKFVTTHEDHKDDWWCWGCLKWLPKVSIPVRYREGVATSNLYHGMGCGPINGNSPGDGAPEL